MSSPSFRWKKIALLAIAAPGSSLLRMWPIMTWVMASKCLNELRRFITARTRAKGTRQQRKAPPTIVALDKLPRIAILATSKTITWIIKTTINSSWRAVAATTLTTPSVTWPVRVTRHLNTRSILLSLVPWHSSKLTLARHHHRLSLLIIVAVGATDLCKRHQIEALQESAF